MQTTACVAAILLCSHAFATRALSDWGVRYEVNGGSGWSPSLSIDVSAAPRTVDFRISVYHDGMPVSSADWGTAPAWAPLRLCNSQKILNFGSASMGDSLLSFTSAVGTANPQALISSQSGPDRILGTPNSLFSFASDTGYLLLDPRPQRLETIFYTGRIRVGNTGPAALSRVITLTANSFAHPGADDGTGGIYGASFATSAALAFGVALQPAVPLPAVIIVGNAQPCPADLNGDGEVSDPDFALFALAYDLFDCAAPTMPANCPADLNGSNSVDDSDFAAFAAAYDLFACP